MRVGRGGRAEGRRQRERGREGERECRPHTDMQGWVGWRGGREADSALPLVTIWRPLPPHEYAEEGACVCVWGGGYTAGAEVRRRSEELMPAYLLCRWGVLPGPT